jgi:hypothetical protein
MFWRYEVFTYIYTKKREVKNNEKQDENDGRVRYIYSSIDYIVICKDIRSATRRFGNSVFNGAAYDYFDKTRFRLGTWLCVYILNIQTVDGRG